MKTPHDFLLNVSQGPIMNRRRFLATGICGLLGAAGIAAGQVGTFSPTRSRSREDLLGDWREKQPPKSVNEDDPNVFIFSRLRFITRSSVFASWDSYPFADDNLLAFTRNVANIKVSNKTWEERKAAIDDFDQLYKRPFVFMTGEGDFRLSREEAAAFREYFRRGGFLYADDCVNGRTGDFFFQAFIREMGGIFPRDPMKPIPLDHEIFHCLFDLPQGAPFCQGQPHPAMGLFLGDRLVGLVTPGDLHCGWTGFWKDSNPQLTTDCFRMGANIIVYSLTH